MKKIFIPLFFATLVLEGCGGGSGGNESLPDQTPPSSSSSKSSGALSSLSSSSSSSSSSSKSSSISSSSPSSKASSSEASSSSQATSSIPFTLTSNSFVVGDYIPTKYSCNGIQVSPHLKWDITSDAVKSFALIMEDIDAIAVVGHPYVHWAIYNIPGSLREISEGTTRHDIPVGSVEGTNDDLVALYSGPCPPPGTGIHHYYFALYALNTETLPVDLHNPVRRHDFETLYTSNIIQKVEIIGLFKP